MKAYIFLSVHAELFHRVAERLRARGVSEFCGFAWGTQQVGTIANRGIDYDPMVVFTRDLLPLCDDGAPPDLDFLERRERELGVSLVRMLAAERHLLKGRSFTQLQRMAEVALRQIAAAFDQARPDFVFSEDVSCFHSYVHYVLAVERGIPFWRISSGRLPNRLNIYATGFQRLEGPEKVYQELLARELTDDERRQATEYVTRFRERPARLPGMAQMGQRPSIGLKDLPRVEKAVRHYLGDRKDPTAVPPLRVFRQRLERIVRIRIAETTGVFEAPVPGEKYVLYPLHFQPEASTLVQAPLYCDQVQLLEDIAHSLPIGHRLYVKEHVSSRGRRPLAFYEAIRKIKPVRLLSPDEDTWSLIQGAAAIAVITGTVGWEGLLYEKPVVTFGDVFFNALPHVYKASEVPKDRWYELFRQAIFDHHPDQRSVLAYVLAMHQGSCPGVIHNPTTFPHVLEAENVEHIAAGLAAAIGLPASGARLS